MSTDTTAPDRPRARAEVLTDAVAALTEAARLTSRDGEGHSESADWAEFVSHALAGAAANIGGVDLVLAGRPGSWEADYVRNLLHSTVGYEEEVLLEHRTEPLVVPLYVDLILADLGVWKVYEDAYAELNRRYHGIGPTPPAVPTEDQERRLDELADLEERLEQQRLREWAAYGDALKAHIEAAAAGLTGLSVPVVVTVDLHTWPASDTWWGEPELPCRLRAQAIEATLAPAADPLHRLQTERDA